MEVKGNFIVHGSYIDIHDNEVVNLSVDKAKVMVNGKEVNTTDTADDNQPATRKGGRTAEYLFCDDEKQKDEALSLKMAKVFVASLDKELLATPINSSKKNSINRAFVQMYKEWRNEKLVPPQPNGKACVRFLQEDCKLQIGVDEKTYAEFIRRWIVED